MKTKRIALISLSIPTFNNVRAASALPFHLILGAKDGGECEVEVWTFNINHLDDGGIRESEKQLGVRIHLLTMPTWYQWMFRLHLVFLRILLRYPLLSYFRLNGQSIREIDIFQPSIVWIYGEELAGLADCFPQRKVIVTMPDCETMYYHRALTMNFLTKRFSQVLRYSYAYWQYRSMDRHYWRKGVTCHFVGKADAEFYKGINPKANAIFLRHPHYAWRDRMIRFHQPRIRLLFAGRYDFYCQHGSDALLMAMLEETGLKEHYEVTFLGKGWESWHEKLARAGWKARVVTFAPDYIDELHKHDIQVNAIDLGTGTKGKVLDAMANGLLVMGTPYALENIAGKSETSCIEYNQISDAIRMLHDIPYRVGQYEQMTEEGRQQVLTTHSRKMIARQLFSIE